jgi:hypothetical protein
MRWFFIYNDILDYKMTKKIWDSNPALPYFYLQVLIGLSVK